MKTFKKHIQNRLINYKFNEMTSIEKDLNILSRILYERRIDLNLSHDELAVKSKVKAKNIFNIENGFNIELSDLLKICRALDVKLKIEY